MAYATIEDILALAMSHEGLGDDFEEDEINQALEAASSEADSRIATRHPTPLTSWPRAVRLHVAKMALFHVMSARGYRPGGVDDLIRQGYDDGIRFFRDVADGRAILITAQTAPKATGKPSVCSEPDRGFGRI
jgi:phage gp36-like protein